LAPSLQGWKVSLIWRFSLLPSCLEMPRQADVLIYPEPIIHINMGQVGTYLGNLSKRGWLFDWDVVDVVGSCGWCGPVKQLIHLR
jgi:hypothetical protein